MKILTRLFTKNKIFVALMITSFVLNSCTGEYWSYHSTKEKEVSTISNWVLQSNLFDVNKIEERNFEILSAPDKTIIDKFVNKINKAKTRIYIETYIFTEKRILKSVIDAKKRWLDVQIILEPNVFWLWNINKKTFDSVNNIGVKVVYSSASNYNFTHSKFFIIDNEYIISTWNISYSTYTQNKEFFVFWNNSKDLTLLEKIFKKDYIWEKYIECSNTIISSPICSRTPLEAIIKSAKKNIFIYEQSIDDVGFQKLLIEKHKAWVNVKLIIGDINKAKSNKEAFDKFKKERMQIIAPKKPYIHAKAFLIDDKILYIWSINLTKNSIENNREIGILFKDSEKALWFKNEFERLFPN